MSEAARAGEAGAVACLVNVYPAASHSFIRREIAALERAGWCVHRFSHRHAPATVDPADESERPKTEVLLDRPGLLAFAVLAWLRDRPLATLRALAAAAAMAWRSHGRIVTHLGYFVLACRLAQRMQRLGCRHVHAHFGTNPAAVAWLAHRIAGIGYSLTFHGPHEFVMPDRLDLRRKIAGAHFVATVSRHGLGTMRDRHPAHAHRFVHVPCGLDRDWLDAPPTPCPAAARLVAVTRLEAQKDPLLLIEAAGLLRARGLAFTLVIVGGGSLAQRVRERRDALGLQHAVVLAGWGTQAKVRQELLASRALVLSSRDEGLPVAIMEAFALGRPAIAPDVGGVRELVDTGATGWVCAPGDARALAEAMRACLDAPAHELDRLGATARQRVQVHDADRSARLLAERFHSAQS